jgi:glycosyltransferase involved in cell wall biosynthesis
MISICLITYNQEKFIRQTIESILAQKCSMPYELIIGEDCSKDKTRSTCLEYADRYPGLITVLDNEHNLGMIKNFTRCLEACRGEFIAFIEGDDYWTDDRKLEKQVAFLQANPGYSACFHNVILKFERTNENAERVFHKDLSKNSFDTEDLLGQWFIPSGSVLFKNYFEWQLPDWFFRCQSGDIAFMLLLSLRGKIKYLDEVMGVYRIHDNGISSTHNGYEKIIGMIFLYESFNTYTHFRFHKKIREAEIYEIDRHYPKPPIGKPEADQKPVTANKLSKRISGKLKKVLGLG